MSESRPFPPSPRRLALARRAGLSAASPLVVGALAAIAAMIAAVLLAHAVATSLAQWIAAACRGDGQLTPAHLATTTLAWAAPLLGTAALAALVAHVGQTRALWLPRRRIPGAPVLARRPATRTAFDLAAALIIGAVAFGWLWTTAPQLAALVAFDPPSLLAGVGAALASLVVALAIAWLALGVLDALVRHTELARALAMTATEKREDDRLAAADPRWRARRLALMRGPTAADAVAGAALVLVGEGVAVAIAWDPRRQPVPLRSATGRRARATQLIGLARRYRIPVHRDVELAAVLAGGEGPVPDPQWPRLAEIIAALRR